MPPPRAAACHAARRMAHAHGTHAFADSQQVTFLRARGGPA